MVFSGIPFLYYFLPCALLAYFLAPKKLKNTVLLLFSLLFYAWGEPRYVLLMGISIVQGYGFGLLVERYKGKKGAKVALGLSVFFSLGMLGYYKYADFFISAVNGVTGLSIPLFRIALPIGISFYTFQILSYVVDVYRGQVRAQRNFIDLAAYISMFPQLIAGPIVRYSDIESSLKQRQHSLASASQGIRRFLTGLGKKVLLANTLGELCSLFRESEAPSVLFFWVYAVAYTLHIYYDFSGYSDMAIGLGKLFGFHFPENFRYPFISGSITEFWRRWHISLGSWFRDYVYIPLGGNRVSTGRWVFNALVVWMLTGLWHGAAWTFVLWGLLFAVLLVLEKLVLARFLEKHKVLARVYVLPVLLFSFVLFDASSAGEALYRIGAMLGLQGLPAVSTEVLYYLKSYALLLGMAALGATPLLQKGIARLREKSLGEKLLNAGEPLFLLALLLLSTAYLVDGSFNPFLYFRF